VTAACTIVEELDLIDVRVHAHAGAANGPANGSDYDAGRGEYDVASALIIYEEYHPFGTSAYRAVDSTIEVSPKRYRYAAAERDEETGLDHMGLRYYAPWLGRWTSADPIGISGGINLYEYAASNPVGMVDRGGTRPQTVHQEGMKQFESRAADIRQQEAQVSRSEADFQTRVRETLGPEGFANLDADPAERQALIDEGRSLNFARSDLDAMSAELDADIKAFRETADPAARIGRYARPVEIAGLVVLGGTAVLLAAPFAIAAAQKAAMKAIVASPGGAIAAKELAFEFAQGEGGALPRGGTTKVATHEAKAAIQEAKVAARKGDKIPGQRVGGGRIAGEGVGADLAFQQKTLGRLADELVDQGVLIQEEVGALKILKFEGPKKLANPDPLLGKSTAGERFQVTVENAFGEIFEFSVNYDPVSQIFGTIKRASGKP
jgi:RHS repeat-associated protein